MRDKNREMVWKEVRVTGRTGLWEMISAAPTKDKSRASRGSPSRAAKRREALRRVKPLPGRHTPL